MDSFHSVSKSSQYAIAASPGVSLERGNYRMRAPNIRPLPSLLQAQKTPGSRLPRQRANRHLALLVMLLVSACITCFGLAYYLYVTRWDLRAVSATSIFANSTSEVIVFEENSLNRSEKYLSYLPHSGFHNQRIALENALVLAYVLRRTLLVPPIRLGHTPIRYVEYDTLSQYHELSGREGLDHCHQIAAYISRPSECFQYFESAYVPWTWLVDFSMLSTHQTMAHLPNMSPTWIREHFSITPSEIYTLRDDSPYRFRFLDDTEDSSPSQDRYLQDMYMFDLMSVNEKLLRIGTLFGTSRLRLKNSENLAYRAAVRRNMVFANEDFSSIATSIAQYLKHSYVGIHLRLGDGLFKEKIHDTVDSIWFKVLRDVHGLLLPEICELETHFSGRISAACSTETAGLEVSLQNFFQSAYSATSLELSSTSGLICRGTKHTEPRLESLNIPLYVATDLPTPETHPLLSIFRQTFPCLFFLGDFSSAIRSLKELKGPYDRVYLNQFAMPFVDALVVSKALKVVGTEGSTFSRFVEEVLWVSSHGSSERRPVP